MLGLEDEWAVVNVVAKQNAERINKERRTRKKLKRLILNPAWRFNSKFMTKFKKKKNTTRSTTLWTSARSKSSTWQSK